MQTNDSEWSIRSMAALKRGWDDPMTPPLPKACIRAAEGLKETLDRDYPKVEYEMSPAPGGFVCFVFPGRDLIIWLYGQYEQWPGGDESDVWAEALKDNKCLKWVFPQHFNTDLFTFLTPGTFQYAKQTT